MRFNIFKYVLAPAVMMAAVLTASTAKAETLNVPFNFTVAGQTCPAGLYKVDRTPLLGVSRVTLTSMSSSQSFFWSLNPGDPAPTDTRIVLRFDQVGQTHALRTVQYGNVITAKIKDGKRQAESMATTGMVGQ